MMDALWAVGQDGRALNLYSVHDLRRRRVHGFKSAKAHRL